MPPSMERIGLFPVHSGLYPPVGITGGAPSRSRARESNQTLSPSVPDEHLAANSSAALCRVGSRRSDGRPQEPSRWRRTVRSARAPCLTIISRRPARRTPSYVGEFDDGVAKEHGVEPADGQIWRSFPPSCRPSISIDVSHKEMIQEAHLIA
jgi:hypothetical protein